MFHQIDARVEGHLFISVLAYHCVHMLRETLATQQRRDGRTVHVRKATRPEAHHHKIKTILGYSPNPGGTHRVLV